MTREGNRSVAYIPNALDMATNLARRRNSECTDVSDLECLHLSVDLVDLKEYFHRSDDLKDRLESYDILWVRGGNTFVLAQAMKLSGLDEIVKGYYRDHRDIVYGGYSAGICILGPTLEGIHLVDDPNEKPYGNEHETIWSGLGILDFSIAPHYQSDHPESADVDSAIEYMKDHQIPFKTLKDGEVIIIESCKTKG